MIIGITGGTGSGKTTFLKLIEACGGTVLDCDAIYHELLRTDRALLEKIEAAFPGTVENGVLNRKKLGAIVFAEEQKLLQLNKITHSAVKAEVLKSLDGTLVAIDAIGLFEGGLAPLCDVTVAVTAPLEARVARLMQRDGISEDYARSRINAQHDENWYRSHCNHILENNGKIEDFTTNCLAFLRNLGIIKTTNEQGDVSHDQ